MSYLSVLPSTSFENGFIFVYLPTCHIFASANFTANTVVHPYCKCSVSYVNIYKRLICSQRLTFLSTSRALIFLVLHVSSAHILLFVHFSFIYSSQIPSKLFHPTQSKLLSREFHSCSSFIVDSFRFTADTLHQHKMRGRKIDLFNVKLSFS
jgi:hypothetical protein